MHHRLYRFTALVLVAISTVLGQTLWSAPLGPPLTISGSFSLPNGVYQAGHRGIDLPAVPGQDVYSPTAAIVSYVGTVVDRPVISLRVDEHTILTLEPVSSDLRLGDRVAQNQVIGEVASGGHCADACVHVGVRLSGDYINPLRFFRSRPELIPW